MAVVPFTSSPPGWGYDYNLRGEVGAAVRSDADGIAITGQGWGYAYDAIGSRCVATRDVGVGASTGYVPNALNQYASLINPGSEETDTAVGLLSNAPVRTRLEFAYAAQGRRTEQGGAALAERHEAVADRRRLEISA